MDEGTAKHVVKYANLVMENKGEEWVGRSEETFGSKSEIKTVSIKYVKGSGTELTETKVFKEKDSSEKWNETGTVVKKMHFDSLNKLQWAEVEFHFGDWQYSIHIEVQKENERIDKSSPNTVKTDFGPKKFDGKPQNIFYGTILGYLESRIDAKLSVENRRISYTEVTDVPMISNRLIVNIQKYYGKKSKEFQSFSAGITFIDKNANRKLDASAHLASESAKLVDFLSQEPVNNLRKETELKTGNLS